MSQQERCPTANDAAVILYEIAAKADELEGMPVDYGLAMELAKVVKRIKESVDRPQGSVVAEQPQPAKKPPYTASDKAVRIVLGAQPKFVVIEPEAHCSLITEDTLLIWAEQPSREQATSSGSGILEPHKTSLAVTEGQGEPNGAALPDSPREQAVEGLVRAARLALGQLLYLQRSSENLPSTQNTITEVEAALAHYEASRGERQ